MIGRDVRVTSRLIYCLAGIKTTRPVNNKKRIKLDFGSSCKQGPNSIYSVSAFKLCIRQRYYVIRKVFTCLESLSQECAVHLNIVYHGILQYRQIICLINQRGECALYDANEADEDMSVFMIVLVFTQHKSRLAAVQ